MQGTLDPIMRTLVAMLANYHKCRQRLLRKRKMLKLPAPSPTVLYKLDSTFITVPELGSLVDGKWLSDGPLNFVVAMLKVRACMPRPLLSPSCASDPGHHLRLICIFAVSRKGTHKWQ